MTSRTHVVTGAGAGIGQALARVLLTRGDRVITLARSEERAAEVRADLGPGCEVLVCDLAERSQVVTCAHVLAEAFAQESIDSLVHSAGVVDLGPLHALDADAWQRQLDVNLTAPALLSAALLPALRRSRGTVVMINSGAGQVAHAHWGGYAASKHGLRALADAMRAEEAPHGVRVTSVYPSRTATDMQEKVHLQEGRPYSAAEWMQPESVAASVVHVLDLPVDATVPELSIRTAPS